MLCACGDGVCGSHLLIVCVWKNVWLSARCSLFGRFLFSAVLTTLDLSLNDLDAEAGKALAKALEVNGVLTKLNMKYNILVADGKKALQDAVKGRKRFELLI